MTNINEGYREIKIGKPVEEVEPTVIEVSIEDELASVEVEPAPAVETKVEEKHEEEPTKPAVAKAEHNSRAQKRIKQLLADKQEAQAALERERQEKAELMRMMAESNKSTKTDLKASLESQIASLTKQMTQAIQNGESELVVELQDKLMDAKIELKGLSYELKHSESVNEKPRIEQPTQQNTIPEAALNWIEEYPMFKTDSYFRNITIVENNQLLSEGYDPKTDEFYSELNSRLSSRFPKIFGVQEENGVSLKSKTSSSEVELDAEPDVKPKASSKVRTTEQTVSGSSRPSAHASAPRKSTSVTLTPEHIRQAERWGLSLEQMARRIAYSDANKRPDGYVPINMGKN